MKNPILVDLIIDAMKKEIEKYSLELLQRYPNDLLVIDRARLERYAVPGAHIAWMVGHSHTHLSVLGLHPKENETVTYVTNLSNDDRFYQIKINPYNVLPEFTMKEISSSDYGGLIRVRVPYSCEGNMDGFWLMKEGRRIGSIVLTSVGTLCKPQYKVLMTPVAGITELDLTALYEWSGKAVVKAAHTLFVCYDIEEAAPIHLLAAA